LNRKQVKTPCRQRLVALGSKVTDASKYPSRSQGALKEEQFDKYFEPFTVGRIWVAPPRSVCKEPLPDAESVIPVHVAQGEAWGTGEHETTKLCVEYLSESVQGGELVLDYGCGTGILAICAVKLGAKKAVGVDIVPEAVATAAHNRDQNGISEEELVAVCVPGEEHIISEQFRSDSRVRGYDICMSNILLPEQKGLVIEIADLVRPGGTLCLSGIIEEDVTEATGMYSLYFDFEEPRFLGPWARLVGTRNDFRTEDDPGLLAELSESAL